jgi:hypothetical protein
VRFDARLARYSGGLDEGVDPLVCVEGLLHDTVPVRLDRDVEDAK